MNILGDDGLRVHRKEKRFRSNWLFLDISSAFLSMTARSF